MMNLYILTEFNNLLLGFVSLYEMFVCSDFKVSGGFQVICSALSANFG